MQKRIVVIGGGPGGYVAAIRGAQLGAKVTLIERHKIGGTCLNYGCIPTKTLYKNAELLHTLKHIEDFGIKVDHYSIDVDKIQSRKDEVVHTLVSGIEQVVKANGVEIIDGSASFIDAKTLKVVKADGETIEVSGDDIIIATGSTSAVPPFEGVNLPGVVTSKELLEFKSIPEKLVIIGGGVISMEFAGIFAALGSEVSVVIRSDKFLREVDSEITKRFGAMLKKKGIELNKSVENMKIIQTESGLKVTGDNKKGPVEFPADTVLLSTGRVPVYKDLNLDAAGVEVTKKGIAVDHHTFKTNVDNVYAIGDVNGIIMLAHAASHQGIAAVESIMGIEHKGNHDAIPNCIFVFPEIAGVGITEDEANEKGIEIKKSKFMFGANGKALSIGEPDGFIKVISDMNDVVLGVHIMGPHASDLIAEGTLAVANRMTVDQIANTVHAHPTLAESFAEATLGLRGEAIHMAPPKVKK
ncbi:dihydrolipoyl dehydrogenase [Fusibacter bizertensis]|uniref:Dihydrolipoyl dehydrogenase n=1 Tax=Fusibacter bizertensis TaxID=1488331 RepID=A0ABT6NG78_9FIRM|nr:dihydrolipoyl dehydrogenase [Fusibacter bizertensis]MDH8679439.1 dihydrolipoyl dehydrogenase [Fusibacter bizertensis]